MLFASSTYPSFNSCIETLFAVSSQYFCANSGLGVNLDNRIPTTCINEVIAQFSSMASAPHEKLAPLSREKLFALTFTQLEHLLNAVQAGHIQRVLDLYYSYWLHRCAYIMARN